MPTFENLPHKRDEQPQNQYLQEWAEASGADEKAREEFAILSRSIPPLPAEPIEAAKALRLHLIENGFNYSEDTFLLSELLQKKEGSCLGYTLLYASLLAERGFKPEFKILMRPFDAVDRQDRKLFNELSSGEYFPYDKPALPKLSERSPHPINRFTPLNHPMLVLDGKPFEPTTTDKEAIDENPVYLPKAEASQDVSFSQLSSFVYVDRAKQLFQEAKRTGTKDIPEARALVEAGLEKWGDNRDAWGLLWEVGELSGDPELQERAAREYERIGGDDSHFLYMRYHMIGDTEYLDAALKQFPEYIPAFLDKKVFLEPNQKEAKFNLAVGMWAVAHSAVLKLEDYYQDKQCQSFIRRLYGEAALRRVSRRS